jgi:outer membrane protein OmpA-like peptidoglycan-associated protein
MARDGITRAIGATRPARLAVVVLLLGAAAANAQDGGTAKGAGNGSVTVDLSVLDSLRPAPANASRPRGTVRLIPPAGTASSGNNAARLRPPGSAPSAAPPPLTKAPPPPPPELLGDTASPPPAAEAAPTAKVSPAEPAPAAEPKDSPPPSVVEPPTALSEPPTTTTDKGTPEAAPPPPPVAALPPPSEEPAAAATPEAPSKAPQSPAAAPSPPAQSAALPKAPKAPSKSDFGAGATRAIAYAAGKADLPDDAQATLRAAVASLKADPALRIQLKAYAAGGKESESRARRLSLSRALGVRSFLIKQGIEPTRIDVRALGSNVPDGSPERVDVSLVAR